MRHPRSLSNFARKHIFFYFIFLVLCQYLFGQAVETTGTVRGIVTDTSGAIIPGCMVVLDGESTGQHLVRVTNESGIFVFPSQSVGVYKLEVSAQGFRKEKIETVNVQVGQTANLNVRLQPG
ncbi:MAG TPA: carboxypeptidase-like regulatory domain-containing protein, partial [Nitrososphaera sp.]|nr:carboxypeptidase-like regulatory domain-containing protein [Nitrososphaera sp.]